MDYEHAAALHISTRVARLLFRSFIWPLFIDLFIDAMCSYHAETYGRKKRAPSANQTIEGNYYFIVNY